MVNGNIDSIRRLGLKRDLVGKGWGGFKKGGLKDMPEFTVELEVERVINLVRGFGWEKIKEEIVDDEIHITIKKKTPAAAEAAPPAGPS